MIDDFDSDAQLVQRTGIGPYSGYDLSQFSAPLKKLARGGPAGTRTASRTST